IPSKAQPRIYRLPKMGPSDLQKDFSLLQKILEANHPSLYWYTPKAGIDSAFTAGIAGITDSLDEVAFRNRIATVLSLIRCGHTYVRFSRQFEKQVARYRYPAFPLYLKIWPDTLVILGSMFPGDRVFKRGTQVLSINGRSPDAFTAAFFPYIVSDGYAFNYKYASVSSNFPAWYKTILGLDTTYRIRYIDSLGRESIAVIPNYLPVHKKDSIQPIQKAPGLSKKQRRKLERLQRRYLRIDTLQHIAYMHLADFSGGRLRGFFRRSFRALHKTGVEHLVLDVRDNEGGRVNNSVLLGKYLADHPFKVGDTVVAISRRFRYGRYIHPAWIYWLAMNLGAHKEADGLIHFRRYERKRFEPDKRWHFSGRIWVLQGGLSFSATTMLLGTLKGQPNVKLVGEETGGGYYGSSAMYLPTIRLPHSGLRISLPLYRLVEDANRPKGQGVMPDIPVPPSLPDIRAGIDTKMTIVRKMISKSNE
ncbi:MAG TPA: S41 family peptidase, partial [Sediminibacterium sp.]|nr:S41 family peptidase [Sediminibacterium sp.]